MTREEEITQKVVKQYVEAAVQGVIEKYNHNHGAGGRFASSNGGGATAGGAGGGNTNNEKLGSTHPEHGKLTYIGEKGNKEYTKKDVKVEGMDLAETIQENSKQFWQQAAQQTGEKASNLDFDERKGIVTASKYHADGSLARKAKYKVTGTVDEITATSPKGDIEDFHTINPRFNFNEQL